MPLPNPRYGARPTPRQLQRATNNITLSTRPGAGTVIRKCGNHYIIEAKRRKQGAAGGGSTLFPCKITGNASLASGSTTVGGGSSVTVHYRWKYAWTEMEPIGDGYQVKSGGRSGTTTTDYALNNLEVNHTVTVQWGVTINAAPYPTGFRPRPVGAAGTGTGASQGTHTQDIIVRMEEVTDANGDTKYWFETPGSHTGTCS